MQLVAYIVPQISCVSTCAKSRASWTLCMLLAEAVVSKGSSSKQRGKKGTAKGAKPMSGTPPKKGGLVNVQRAAVKGYLIHK